MNTCLVHASLRSFADDTRIVKKIDSMDDVDLLQTDLDRIIEWSAKKNMQLHQDKFESYSITSQILTENYFLSSHSWPINNPIQKAELFQPPQMK